MRDPQEKPPCDEHERAVNGQKQNLPDKTIHLTPTSGREVCHTIRSEAINVDMESEIIAGLMARGIPGHIAEGIMTRMRAESGLDPGISETAPVVEGSRGGFGLNQWTGPRRVQFEKFAADRGAPVDDLNTQLDFTMWELQNTEKSAFDALKGVKTPDEAARVYMERFLRPGVPHADMRGGFTYAGVKPTTADPKELGFNLGEAVSEKENPYSLLGQALMDIPKAEAPQILPRQVVQYAPQKRDTIPAYLKLFQSLG